MKDIDPGGNTRSAPSSEADVRAGCQKVTNHAGPPAVPTGCTTRRNTPCSYPTPLRSSDSSTALRHNCHTVPRHTGITIVLYGASLFMMGTTYPLVQPTLPLFPPPAQCHWSNFPLPLVCYPHLTSVPSLTPRWAAWEIATNRWSTHRVGSLLHLFLTRLGLPVSSTSGWLLRHRLWTPIADHPAFNHDWYK